MSTSETIGSNIVLDIALANSKEELKEILTEKRTKINNTIACGSESLRSLYNETLQKKLSELLS